VEILNPVEMLKDFKLQYFQEFVNSERAVLEIQRTVKEILNMARRTKNIYELFFLYLQLIKAHIPLEFF
jgi:hypothetical protein